MCVPWRDPMEENRIFNNHQALSGERVWYVVNLLQGFIFPVDLI